MIVTMRSFVPRDAFLFSAPLSLLIPRARAFARLHELNLYSNLFFHFARCFCRREQ